MRLAKRVKKILHFKGQTKIEYSELLKNGAHEFGVELSDKQIILLSIFLEELWSWNRVVNLSGITERREMVIKLLLDSLVALPYLPSGGTLLDIGSGAGVPGLIIKIARPEIQVHLLESRAKKVSFARNVIRRLNLKGIYAYNSRAEKNVALPGLFPLYNIVTARALASVKKTINICSPYLGPGSILVTFKGPGIDKEIEESRDLMSKLHLTANHKISYKLPEVDRIRYLLILNKGNFS